MCCRNGPSICSGIEASAFIPELNFCGFCAAGESQTPCDSQSMTQPASGGALIINPGHQDGHVQSSLTGVLSHLLNLISALI